MMTPTDGERAAADGPRAVSSTPRGMTIVCVAGLAICGMAGPAWAAGPFASFAGAWRGAGHISMADGSRASIRCKATYAVNPEGDAMNIDVDCASDSYRVDIVASVVARGKSLSGQWQETTRQVQGDVTGQVPGPGELQASLEGTGFGIQLSIATRGRRQAVTVQSDGTDVHGATIKLRR